MMRWMVMHSFYLRGRNIYICARWRWLGNYIHSTCGV